MGYVLVPVPEELVIDVMTLVVRNTAKPARELSGWEPDAMESLFRQTNEPTRSLLSYMALPKNAGRKIPTIDVARALELSLPDLSGIVGPLNKHCKAAYGCIPPVESERVGAGRRRSRVLHMSPEVAEMVRAAEKKMLREEMAAHDRAVAAEDEPQS